MTPPAAHAVKLRTRRAQNDAVRVALVGKGGAGKTMIAGTLARLLARRGRKVLAVDLDSNPGLQFSLGLGASLEAGLPLEALEEHEGSVYGWRLREGVTAHEAVERFAVLAPDGVRYLSIGKIHEDEHRRPRKSIAAVRTVAREFNDPSWDVIGDLEAGTTTPFERFHSFADRVLLVVNPAHSSALAARRILPLVDDVALAVVSNRWNGASDHEGFAAVAQIPFDPEARAAEHAGLAPLDHCQDSPAMAAIDDLVELLLAPSPEGNPL